MMVCKESAQFETSGAMFDCSRGAVFKLDTVLSLLRQMALYGLNTLQLYTEDTYKLSSEPFFGYGRGGYTDSELTEIDNYAFNLGIEVFPCIQTLGHLGQILQWPQFYSVKDTSEVILADFDGTYELVEKMMLTVSSSFRSRRIHLGMDEANGIGQGRYKQHHLEQKKDIHIFMNHLRKIQNLCNKHGLNSLIWSDSNIGHF